jgi:hypothetical protein
MRFNARHLYRYAVVGGALVALSCVPSGAWAQQNNTQSADQGQMQAQAQGQFQAQGNVHWSDWTAFNQFLDAHPDVAEALRANPDLIYDTGFMGQHQDLKNFCDMHPGIRQDMDQDRARFRSWFRVRRELATMDRFFGSHPDTEHQLEANPGAIDNQSFLQNHSQLVAFLNQNPGVKDAFDRSPSLFMNLEERFQARLSGRFGNGGAGGYPGFGQNPNPHPGQNGYPGTDQRRDELAATAQFFDAHPDTEMQLQSNPDLINNASFMQRHPELQAFLNSHPEIKSQFDANPMAFLSAELRFQGGPGAVAMDQFLNAHPDVAKQLEANPSLINNAKYLQAHPELRAVLNSNPQLREMFTQNPSAFLTVAYRTNGTTGNAYGRADVATMDQYLDKHPGEARDLNAYPARINDSDYLAHHKDLDAFLKKHPDVRDEFTHNPSSFMHQESNFDACAQMDDFLNNHRNLAKDLNSNPDNVKDDSYLNHHKDLKGFLAKNPGVSDQFQGNPSGFMDQERKFEANRQFDVYLSTHKGVAKDLQKNPDQVKDAKYLDHHKDLKGLMDKNPELAQAANTNPSAFMQEQMQFHEQYKNQHIQEKTKVEQRATTHGAQ